MTKKETLKWIVQIIASVASAIMQTSCQTLHFHCLLTKKPLPFLERGRGEDSLSPLPFWGGVGGEAILEVERPMSHAAGSAQRCSQCGEDTYQYLNHHFPF